jgi:hypothetical protein
VTTAGLSLLAAPLPQCCPALELLDLRQCDWCDDGPLREIAARNNSRHQRLRIINYYNVELGHLGDDGGDDDDDDGHSRLH